MNQYEKIDQLILKAIGIRSSPLYNYDVCKEAYRLRDLTGRENYRIIDGRVQALRKRGVIRFVRGTRAHWELV